MNTSSINPENLQKLIDIGISLSKEKNIDILLENILTEARQISNSDGGTLYLMIDNDTRLEMSIVQNESMNMFSGGTYGKNKSLYPVKLYDSETGKENLHNISAACALQGRTILIEDIYTNTEFDLSGPKGFD